MTFVRGDAVVAAKTISDFIKANDVLAYKGGLMDGATLEPEQFNAIAKLPGVETLRGQLVGLAASPLSGVVRTLNQLLAGLAQQLGQVAEQGLVSGEPPAEPEAEEPAAAAADEPKPETEEPAAEAEAETTSESEDEADQTPEEGGDDADADAGDEKED